MVGVCGLVHGVSFAAPPKDLDLRGAELVRPLPGFNAGVELEQLAVLALLLPVALRSRGAYRRWTVPGLSNANPSAGGPVALTGALFSRSA